MVDAKEYLRQYLVAKAKAEVLEEQINQLQTESKRITSTLQADVVHGGEHRTMEDVIAEIVELKQEFYEQIRQTIDKRREVAELVYSIKPDSYSDLLVRRYLLDHSFERVAVDMNYSYRQVLRIHGHALQLVREKMSHNVT